MPGRCRPYTAVVIWTVVGSGQTVPGESRAMTGMRFNCSSAAGGKSATASLPTSKQQSGSPRDNISGPVNSPGLYRGYPCPKFTPNGYPVCHASTESAPATSPYRRIRRA